MADDPQVPAVPAPPTPAVDPTPAPTPPADDGLMHHLASTFGIDPEAIKTAAKAFYHHPIQAAEEVGSEAGTRAVESAAATFGPRAGQATQTILNDVGHTIHDPHARLQFALGLAQPGEIGVGEGVLDPLAPSLLKLREHLADTARTAVEGAKEEITNAVNAKAPEGSTEAGTIKTGKQRTIVDGEDVVKHVQKYAKPIYQNEAAARDLLGIDAAGQYELKNVPVKSLVAGDNYDSKLAQEYASQKTPIPAIVLDQDGKTIVDGNHRVAAAAIRGDKTIPAYVSINSYEPTEAGAVKIGKKIVAQPAEQNAAAGFIRPDGTFQALKEGSHPEDAEKMGTTVPQLRRQGWVRKAGQGSYDVGDFNPQTKKAVEMDIIKDLPDYRAGNEYGFPVSHVVIDTNQGTYEIPVDDFIEKYHGNLDRAMRASTHTISFDQLGGKEVLSAEDRGDLLTQERQSQLKEPYRVEVTNAVNAKAPEGSTEAGAIKLGSTPDDFQKMRQQAMDLRNQAGKIRPGAKRNSLIDQADHLSALANSQESDYFTALKGGNPATEVYNRDTGKLETKPNLEAPTISFDQLGGKEVLSAEDRGGTLLTSERQSALKRPYTVDFYDEEAGKTREAIIEAFSPEHAIKTAQTQFPEANEFGIKSSDDRTPSDKYSVPTQAPLSIRGTSDTRPAIHIMRHEMGHALIYEKEGTPTEGMYRHTHPDMPRNSAAAVAIKRSNYIGPDGKLIPEKVPGLIRGIMGGISADEAFNNYPRAQNHNFKIVPNSGTDGTLGYQILRQAGYNHDGAMDFLHKAIDDNVEYLTQPAASDVIHENEGVREPDLSRQFHYSSERPHQMHLEIQRRIANAADTTGPNDRASSAGGPGGSEENVAGGESESPQTSGQSVQTTNEVTKPDDDIEAKAVKQFGVTDDPKKAGFILADGRGLDFSDGRAAKTLDHGFISTTLPRKGPDAVPYNADPRFHFVARTGAARLLVAKDSINVQLPSTGATDAQLDFLTRTAEQNPGKRMNVDVQGADENVRMGSSTHTPTDRDGVQRLVQDAVQDYNRRNSSPLLTAEKLSPEEKSAREDYNKEKTFAGAILSGAKKVEDFPYYSGYQQTIDAESKLIPKGKTLFVGGGPVPLSSILLDRAGFPVDTLELDPKTATLGEQVARKSGMKGGQFIAGDARNFKKFGDYDNIVVALEAGPTGAAKSAVLQNILDQAKPTAKILARGTAGKGGEAFVDVNKALPEGMRVAESVPTFEGYGQTHVLEPEATPPPGIQKWAQKAAETAAAQGGGFTIHPTTSDVPKTGYQIEAGTEQRKTLDHPATAKDIQDFATENQALLDKHPELHIGGYLDQLNLSAHTQNLEAAKRVAKKLDQISVWDNAKGDEIKTGGTSQRTDFPNYPLEERLKDLRGENQSDIPGFEHLSKNIYDHLEPDERDYLKGDKTLQRNVMSQYHRIQPSVAETTNAMQAGAALGGWWKRYIDVFHNLADGGEQVANTIGPSHAEVLKQWHAALSANKPVRDANNLAWHSYADWLDAGKPTDRKSINDIILKNGAQPEDSGKKINAAISDTFGRRGKIIHEGIDTSKIYNLVNSPEMRGERPFSGDVFREDTRNPLMGKGEGYRKVPSMGATVAGKGNLNRLVIDTHIADFYGQSVEGSASRYIADSAHLRQAAEALGLKGGEGQEQLWGTVLGLKTLLKEGLTPEEAGGKLNADVINRIGKDYAEVIQNDPEITGPGGVLDRLKEQYGIGRGSAGVGEAYRKTLGTGTGEGGPPGGEKVSDTALLGKTAERVRRQISESKIKKPGAAPAGKSKTSALDLIKMLGNLKKPAK